MLRNTDVKKHLGRAVPRYSSAPAEATKVAEAESDIVPVPVTADMPEKVEPA